MSHTPEDLQKIHAAYLQALDEKAKALLSQLRDQGNQHLEEVHTSELKKLKEHGDQKISMIKLVFPDVSDEFKNIKNEAIAKIQTKVALAKYTVPLRKIK